jgi:hypothetical protein
MDSGPAFPPKPVASAPNAAVRTGVYVGGALSLIFVSWIFLANRVVIPGEYVRERNLGTAALLVFVALIPMARFLLAPGKIWVSTLIGWTIFSACYALLSIIFTGLREHFTALQVFVLGAMAYMILATLAWLGNIIGRTWAAHSPRGHHPVS